MPFYFLNHIPVYLSSPNIGTYKKKMFMYFLKIHTLYLYPFSGVVNAIPSVHITQNFWSWLIPYQNLFVFCYNQFQHFLPRIFIFGLNYPTLPINPLKMTWNPLNMHRTCPLLSSSREFEECLNNAGDNTWRKRSQNVNRKPVLRNGIRLLLFDKYKFTKPLKWKKCWTRQTTHLSHIYRI